MVSERNRNRTIVYADYDHAGDYVDRKSTNGIFTFMGCCLTSWFAKKQTALAISTTKAEYVSARKACQQALWMKQALIDYDIRLDDVPIMCDNKGAIDLSKNPVQHSITKHIEISHHFLRDKIQKGNISTEKVASEDNIADIFTKPLKDYKRNKDEELRESYRTLEKRLFHKGRIVTPSFISENNMLPLFQAVGLEPFLTLNEPICPRFVVEFYHSLEVKRDEQLRPYIEFKLGQFTFTLIPSRLSRILQTLHALETFYTSKLSPNSLDDHPNSNLFGPKHDLVKKAITTSTTTQAQLLRDPNKLYIDDICLDLKGWELFFKENL
nr:copia protein [Tanacetum cinerariifolium]